MAVEPASDLSHTHHVLVEGTTLWNAVLGQVDVVKGTNSYYKLQLLEKDVGNDYCVFRSWGRVGTNIGRVKTEVIMTCRGVMLTSHQCTVKKAQDS